ncbi:murein hydrolase activator EnvC family protein [Planctobacterium marinum]|uniref:Non-catalytic member of peptidase subfamily M23B n=1 Tax=Planctobacterium marinum TaxID=1631968 RepID=A0AA48HK87_9ALTE|nr:non-catalytic member of peptidase subfamily M23B [Planctobacterium marinum]
MIKTKREQRILLLKPLSLVWLLCLLIAIPGHAQTEEDLKSIQDEIKNRQTDLNAKVRTAESLQAQLRDAELEIAKLTKQSIISSQELKLVQDEQKRLQDKHKQLTAQKQTQLKLLANQIKSAYLAGDHDYTKLLLNQESVGKFERMLVYYQYLNEARKEQIDSFSRLLEQLQETASALEEKKTQIVSLRAKQKAQQEALQQQQKSRETTLAAIQQNIDSEAAQIEQLQINEQQLTNAIAEALAREAARQDIKLSGLRNAKGKLIKPVNGQYRRLFGKRRQGQVRWKGVIFNAPLGRPVSAIHQGKVIFADWLKGMGLVTVIDHGEGYMSLYGHTQALLKQAGDIIEAGETIALVGQSGGQQSPGLYFELRHKGGAINPGNWLDL